MSILVKINRQKPKGFENVIEVIKLRRPKAKDLFGLEFQSDKVMQSCAVLISRCSNLSEKEVEELDSSEFMKLQTEINKFIEGQ